jgi:hypothetical protein
VVIWFRPSERDAIHFDTKASNLCPPTTGAGVRAIAENRLEVKECGWVKRM